MMWIFHKRGGGPSVNGGRAEYWMEQAIRYTKPLEPRKHDREVHDLGFLFMSTFYRWYQITHDPALERHHH